MTLQEKLSEMKNTCGFINGRQPSQIYNKNYLQLKKKISLFSTVSRNSPNYPKESSYRKKKQAVTFVFKSAILVLKELYWGK